MMVPLEIHINMELLAQAMALADRKSVADVVNDCLEQVVQSAFGIANKSVFTHLSDVNELVWSRRSEQLIAKMDFQSYLRTEVSYDPKFLETYAPNRTHLLPARLKVELREATALHLPCTSEVSSAIYERMRLDMIWGSARLEGTSLTRSATKELASYFVKSSNPESTWLHRLMFAFNYLFWGDNGTGLNLEIQEIKQIQSYLTRELPQTGSSIANQKISMMVPEGMDRSCAKEPPELLRLVVGKAAAIKNPFEASFFLWLHLSYLLCFENGIERTARFAMNIPLLNAGYMPISFYEVNRGDYVMALLAYFKLGDPSIAADVFAWAYRQSTQRYRGFDIKAHREFSRAADEKMRPEVLRS